MPRPATLILFALAGIVSAAAAGILVTVIALTLNLGPSAAPFAFIGGIGAIPPAVEFATLPAMLLGGLLWAIGAGRGWARRAPAWLAVGAIAGLAAYPLASAVMVEEMGRLADLRVNVALVFALAGAGAALTFRGAMRLLLLFAPEGLDA